MAPSNPTLSQLIRDARSADQLVRSAALQNLLHWVKEHPASHAAVLPIFRETLNSDHDAYGAVCSAQGVEHIVGGEEARNAWLAVLNHSEPKVAVLAAYQVPDRSYAPVLLELLARRPELEVRTAAMVSLGRLQCREALPMILENLAPLEMRWDAIEALNLLGDPRAIPYLQPYLNDQSSLRRPDDRGWPIDIRDVTGYAIRRLEFLAGKKPATQSADSARATPGVPASALPEPPSRSSDLRRPNLFAYLPLLAALGEFPWIIIVFTSFPKNSGPHTFAENVARIHQMDVLAAIPVAAGLLTGITLLLRGTARRLPERLSIYLGCAISMIFLFFLGHEFFLNRTPRG